jgi:hypothetical protein
MNSGIVDDDEPEQPIPGGMEEDMEGWVRRGPSSLQCACPSAKNKSFPGLSSFFSPPQIHPRPGRAAPPRRGWSEALGLCRAVRRARGAMRVAARAGKVKAWAAARGGGCNEPYRGTWIHGLQAYPIYCLPRHSMVCLPRRPGAQPYPRLRALTGRPRSQGSGVRV